MHSLGSVTLIGAGPGDPGLITVKGLEVLRRADVVVYDRLANPAHLETARADCERIYVGKAAGRHALKQDAINQLLIDRARAGKQVVRLKGGDPFLFGRGGEEAEALVAAGVPFTVIPGVTSAIAVPAYAGIPVTHRDCTSTFAVITGHEQPGQESTDIAWDKVATGIGTLVFLMGVERLHLIVEELIRHGRAPLTPVAVVEWGTMPQQRTVTGTLATIVDEVRTANIRPPAVTIVGEVVHLRERLRWFDISNDSRAEQSGATVPDNLAENTMSDAGLQAYQQRTKSNGVANQALIGKRVIVTRARAQASDLSMALRGLGAEPIEFPTIRIERLEDFSQLDATLAQLNTYDWIIFTSANGVTATIGRLFERGQDVRAFGQARLAAIGPATAEALTRSGLRVDFIPEVFVAESIAEGIPAVGGDRVLLLRADIARQALARELEHRGLHVDEVTVYRTTKSAEDGVHLEQMLRSKQVDLVTFTSSSTVRNFVELLQAEDDRDRLHQLMDGVTVACIGPITADTAREFGLTIDILAEEHTIPGLVSAIAQYYDRRSAEAVRTGDAR